MPSPTMITSAQLARRIGLPDAPALLDVRTDEDAAADPRILPGTSRRNWRTVSEWAAEIGPRPAVVICQAGLKLSQGVAAWLRHAGSQAETLDGGFEAWRDAGLPLLRPDHIPERDTSGRTVWVTRARPKVDRIACPWLIRRFVDPRAVFLFVAPSQVIAVADRFGATPFDIEDVFWSHRTLPGQEGCTFDTMLDEFGLHTDALDRLARIVRGADTSRPDLAPEAAGLLAVSLGLSRCCKDDLAQLDAGMALYDAFYRWCRDATEEIHNWPASPSEGRGRTRRGSGAVSRRATPVALSPAGITPTAARLPSFADALRVWLRIGLLSFGGPAGQIALLHREVVEQRRWIGERRFLHALNFCNLLPGPEAQQLATYLGWIMHGVQGGLAAGLLFVLPGAVVMLGLSVLYATVGDVPLVAALFFGLKCAVLVLVFEALLRIGRRALKGRAAWALAVAAFVALFALRVPFPLVVLAAGAIGLCLPGLFTLAGHGAARDDAPALIDAVLVADPGRPARQAHTARLAGFAALALWLLPVAVLASAGGAYGEIALFFSKMAVVTVGGAYAVLAYVAQDAVQSYGWLSAPEMLAGLGLAETTPGPLILVLQFVSFLAGFRAPGPLSGVAGGIAASVLTLWVSFAPCFAFVFLGAPVIERLQANRALAGALAAITAAVVGVVANLAAWFGIRVLFGVLRAVQIGPVAVELPLPASLHVAALALAALAAVCLFRLRLGVPLTLLVAAAGGVALRTAGLAG